MGEKPHKHNNEMCSCSQYVQGAENRLGFREYFLEIKIIKLNLKE